MFFKTKMKNIKQFSILKNKKYGIFTKYFLIVFIFFKKNILKIIILI